MKKHMLSAFLILAVLLSMPAFAVGGKLTAPTVRAEIGEQVRIPVRLDNPGIVATRIFVRYDSKVLTLDKAENGEVFPNGQSVFGKDLSANPYTMLWDDSLNTSNNTKSGTLCTLTFTVKAGTPTGTASVRIAVDKASTFDTDLNEVTVADCTCQVGVPTVTTKAATTTAAKPAASTVPAAKPAAGSTKTTVTTTKAVVPTSKVISTTTVKTAAPSEKRTTAPTKAGSTAPISTTVSQQTTAGKAAAKESVPASTVPVTAGSEAQPRQDTVPPEESIRTSAPETDTQTESAAVSQTDTPAPQKNLKPLWGLLAIPVAAVLFVVLRRKKV